MPQTNIAIQSRGGHKRSGSTFTISAFTLETTVQDVCFAYIFTPLSTYLHTESWYQHSRRRPSYTRVPGCMFCCSPRCRKMHMMWQRGVCNCDQSVHSLCHWDNFSLQHGDGLLSTIISWCRWAWASGKSPHCSQVMLNTIVT